jgi:hypothetical protein
MATSYKILGQSAPSANTATTLYTVPSATEAIVSALTICNRGNTAATYRIAFVPSGETLANKHYFAYETTVGAFDTTSADTKFGLSAGDAISVYASTANLSFIVSGVQLT